MIASWRLHAYLLICLLVTGCSTLNSPLSPTAQSQITCLPALTQLDKLAEQYAGTLHDHRIPDSPWLRSNRFLASFHREQLSEKQVSTLLKHMGDSATKGLLTEIRFIPTHSLKNWQNKHRVSASPITYLQNCSKKLITHQLNTPKQTISWLRQLTVADSYSTTQRIAGFYPIAAIPFRWGVIKEQASLKQEWANTQNKQWTSYTPPFNPGTKIILPKDALNIPRLSSTQKQQLLRQYAPSWQIDSESPANLPGTPYLKRGKLQVDTHKPATFTSITHGRWKNQITTQLNYLIWFSERPPLSEPDWVAGKHDAVIFRIHLDANQHILAYDSIHLCGCWYRLFLPENTRFRATQSLTTEPIPVEHVTTAKRMQIYLSHDTHQITALQPAPEKLAKSKTYQLREFDELLKLPVFNNSGYVPDSERLERWFFWPMGVKNPGALRRFGEHAISFIGKRHFDDPHLLEDLGLY